LLDVENNEFAILGIGWFAMKLVDISSRDRGLGYGAHSRKEARMARFQGIML
jgi:hypothetical protein